MAYGSVKVDQIIGTNKTVAVDNLTATNVAQTFTKAQRGTQTSVSSTSGVVTLDLATSNNFEITLAEGTQFANPSNQTAGQSGVIVIKQAAATTYSLTWGGNWKFVGGSANAPNATQTAGAVDVIAYYVESSGFIIAKELSNIS